MGSTGKTGNSGHRYKGSMARGKFAKSQNQGKKTSIWVMDGHHFLVLLAGQGKTETGRPTHDGIYSGKPKEATVASFV